MQSAGRRLWEELITGQIDSEALALFNSTRRWEKFHGPRRHSHSRTLAVLTIGACTDHVAQRWNGGTLNFSEILGYSICYERQDSCDV